jgi:hypothetical protein
MPHEAFDVMQNCLRGIFRVMHGVVMTEDWKVNLRQAGVWPVLALIALACVAFYFKVDWLIGLIVAFTVLGIGLVTISGLWKAKDPIAKFLLKRATNLKHSKAAIQRTPAPAQRDPKATIPNPFRTRLPTPTLPTPTPTFWAILALIGLGFAVAYFNIEWVWKALMGIGIGIAIAVGLGVLIVSLAILNGLWQNLLQSGWGRLFIVATVLWLPIGFFICLGQANSTPNALLKFCIGEAYNAQERAGSFNADDLHAREELCNAQAERDGFSPAKLMRILLGSDENLGTKDAHDLRLFAWIMLLGPLVLLWIIGRIVGWIAAGFRNAARSR